MRNVLLHFTRDWRSAHPLPRAFLLSHSFLSGCIRSFFVRDFVHTLGFSRRQWNLFVLRS
jgi:hypothetical protein